MRNRKRVLFVQPSLQPPGGGNAVAAWMIQALVGEHELSVLTWCPISLASMNAYYGTTIAEADITPLEVPAGVRRAIDALPTSAVLLKASLLFRYAKRIVDDYDVVVCGHNETDLGPRCIQYVHYPARLRPRPATDLRWYHWSILLRGYYALCERLDSFAPERVRQAVTLANSSWTAALVARMYGPGTHLRVVHPPVTVTAGRPWSEREDAFVCIGRLAPEKELERVMDIVAMVRRRVPHVRLHIIGSRGTARYGRRIARVARSHGPWVEIHEDVTRGRLFEMIATNRYAIHGMREEHFGIAPAEALAGGCIVFVPNSGGQVDIVGDQRLMYSSNEDAVGKILRVIENAGLQADVREALGARRTLFTAERFMTTIRGLVNDDERQLRPPISSQPHHAH